ncbi:MAG: serine/threonine protein kinase [Deltaproteobacteria bacterium]|nr:serine/threonine protein kinase [Deltaproteobacteria bacterium]
MPESLRDGRFVMLAPLGEGAQGHTFDGVDKREGRAVAIKRFDVRGARAWKDVELAEREARVLRELRHPRLPAYVDHFEADGSLYLVMEKIEGESLAAMRKRGAVLGEGDVVRLLHDAADVLGYLHGRAPAVVHRDLKPGNVIRRPDGSFAFVDFGAVRDKLRPEGGSTVVGTFGYMAPEQFQGRALAASDVYSIGATAITMLTGVEPEALPHRGLGVDVRAALRGRASETMIDILEQMLEIDPDRRASAIAPLLSRFAGRPKRRERHGDWERELGARIEEGARVFEREMQEAARRWERDAHRAEREGRRAERRARHARRMERANRPMGRAGPWPWPFALVATLAVGLAIPVVLIALKLLLPLLFTFLSLFLGRKTFEAPTAAVRAAGDRAAAAMRRAMAGVQRGPAPPREEEREPASGRAPEAPRVRVEPAPPSDLIDIRARVAAEREERDVVAEAEREAEELLAEERARGKR